MNNPKIPKEEHELDGYGKERNAQQEYYEFKLRQEKLAAIRALNDEESFLTQDEADALQGMSEKEKVELKVLGRLHLLSDLDPQFMYLQKLTGKTDRHQMATALADKFIQQELVQNAMNRLVSPDKSRDILETGLSRSQRAYNIFGRA